MTDDNRARSATFNGVNEQEGIREKSEREHQQHGDDLSKADNEISLGEDSIRPVAAATGSTFGMESSTAKYSDLGVKNQSRKGEDIDIEDVNKANQEKGGGGTMYSDYLNQSQNEALSGTGQFMQNEDNATNSGSTNPNSESIRPFDAMQGKRTNGSGGKSEDYQGYDPSGDKRPNE